MKMRIGGWRCRFINRRKMVVRRSSINNNSLRDILFRRRIIRQLILVKLRKLRRMKRMKRIGVLLDSTSSRPGSGQSSSDPGKHPAEAQMIGPEDGRFALTLETFFVWMKEWRRRNTRQRS